MNSSANPKENKNIFKKIGDAFKSMPSVRDLEKLHDRSSLEKYLPWLAYEDQEEIYYNSDQTVGFLWSCTPHFLSDDTTAQALESFFTSFPLPNGTVISFSLLADDNIQYLLEGFYATKKKFEPLLQETTKSYIDYLQECTKGIPQMQGMPLRDFKLYIGIKIPCKEVKKLNINLKQLKNNLTTQLHNAGFSPNSMPPGELLGFARRFFNPNWGDGLRDYLDSKPISEQVILAETGIESVGLSRLKIGDLFFDCISVKQQPKTWSIDQMHKITGSIEGTSGDSRQIANPFLFTVNLVVHNLQSQFIAKNNIVGLQSSGKSTGKLIPKILGEYEEALTNYEKGEQYVRCMPIVWLWNKDPDHLDRIVTQTRNLFDREGFKMQKDSIIMIPMLIASLPFGLNGSSASLDQLTRDFPVPVKTAVRLAVTQSDFNGVGIPTLPLIGRKGQFVSMDFLKKIPNANGVIMASTGAGKSFFTNKMTLTYLGCGAIMRIIDVGYSYKKLCKMLGGRFIDFTPEQKICINPFGLITDKTILNVVDDDDDAESAAIQVVIDFKQSVVYVANIILMMAFPSRKGTEAEKQLVIQAVEWAWKQKDEYAQIDDVQEFLDNMVEIGAKEETTKKQEDGYVITKRQIAHAIADNLAPYSSKGHYGYLFSGKSNFTIESERFVVLELDYLKNQDEDLMKVVTTMMTGEVTKDLYLSDRKEPRMIIFDEAHQFLTADSVMAPMIVQGYRLARKYNGSFWIITQSPLDLAIFGPAGRVIWGNSAYKALLESPDYEAATEEKLIDLKPFELELIKTVRTNKTRGSYYSEIFIKAGSGTVGVARLCLNKYLYFTFSSESEDVSEINDLVASGLSYPEALHEMVRRHP